MNYIIIKFPFSSVNDEDYTLAMVINYPTSVSSILSVLNADTQVFTAGVSSSSGDDTIYNYTGTLTGSVKAVDDEREDLFEPLIASKLTFNMAVETFPAWLVGIAGEYTKVVLYKTVNSVNYEIWRGYLQSQTLNMTVVHDKLSVGLVALDEVSMAKYINFPEAMTFASISDSYMTVYELVKAYHVLHQTHGLSRYAASFDDVYTLLSLTSTDIMYWQRNLSIHDDDGNEILNVPQALTVNLDKWTQDENATWADIFDAVFRYLCVTFNVGAYGSLTDHDVYMLTCPTDSHTCQQYIYMFDDDTYMTNHVDVFNSYSNPTKIGADLQVSTEPIQYNKLEVTSEPQRFQAHKYLGDDEYPIIDKAKFIRSEWGYAADQDAGDFEHLEVHKMYYLKPKSDEDPYLTIHPCQVGEGYLMARGGLIAYDDLSSCDDLTAPDASVADSLDFILFKEGACVIKLGQFKITSADQTPIDEDTNLNNYFLIMNHMWGNRVNQAAYTMQEQHLADRPWLTFTSLGTVAALHPYWPHYLKIKMGVMFIRENFGESSLNGMYLYHPAIDDNHDKTLMSWTDPKIIMPARSSEYTKFNEADSDYYATVQAPLVGFRCRLGIGNRYYNGASWVTVGSGQTPPTFYLRLLVDGTDWGAASHTGTFNLETACYYYAVATPWGADMTDITQFRLIDLSGLSIHGQPLVGQLQLTIMGQIDFINTVKGVGNSIPFLLINDVDITYTDDAELSEADLENKIEADLVTNPRKPYKILERSLEMATASTYGLYNNVMLYDGGKTWNNLTQCYAQYGSTATTPEEMLAAKLSSQYAAMQVTVELSTPIEYDDNIYNQGFVVSDLTEYSGDFMPLKREIDFTLERMRMKLRKLNNLSV